MHLFLQCHFSGTIFKSGYKNKALHSLSWQGLVISANPLLATFLRVVAACHVTRSLPYGHLFMVLPFRILLSRRPSPPPRRNARRGDRAHTRACPVIPCRPHSRRTPCAGSRAVSAIYGRACFLFNPHPQGPGKKADGNRGRHHL